MPAVAMTGGTPAPAGPSPRQTAAQRAVKPRSSAPSVHVHVNLGRPAGSKPTGKAPAKPQAKPGGPVAFNPLSGFLSTQQLGQLADRITRQNMGAQLTPLRQQAGEIQGTEKTVSGRYGGLASSTDTLLQGIGQQAEASATTFQNQAADAALKAGQGVNQAGGAAAGQTAGYLDPQVQAELNAQGKLATGLGGAQNSLTASAGGDETSFMSNLRAAAAQRALEGQRSISELYGGQLAKNQGQQQALIAKQPADAKSLATELGQKQFVDSTTLQGLGIKQAGVQQGQQKINQTAAQNREHDRLSERGQNLTAEHNAATTRLDERKIAETERHNRAGEKTSAERAAAAVKKANGGLTTTQQDKVSGDLGTAYNIVQQLRTANITPQEIRNTLTTGNLRRQVDTTSSSGKKGTKEVTYHYPKIGNQSLITAAFELWNYHKVSPQTASALKGMGVAVPADWTNGSFKGF